MKHSYFGFCSPKPLICTGFLVMFTSFTSLISQVSKSELMPKGFSLNPSGRITAIDSIVPSYFVNYAAGASCRSGLENNEQILEALSNYVQIPVLVSEKFSKEQALANFARSVKFNATGTDPEGVYSNSPGQGGNIALTKEIIKKFLSKEGGIEELFKYQLKSGNYLVVDFHTSLPLYYSSGKEDPNKELQLYRKTLVHWAAAYPWAFYELKNIALKEAIMQSRNLEPLSLFLQHRFLLNTENLPYINQLIQ
jgi:hypothetical protein